MCRAANRLTPARAVDHIVPHKNDKALFWDESNWQGLCFACHNSRKQSIERLGYDQLPGVDGLPTDPKHPFYRKQG